MRLIRRSVVLAALLACTGASTAAADATQELGVVLQPRDPAALDAFVETVSSPSSAHFGRHLLPGEFGERFGPTPQTVAQVSAALRAAGLEPGALPDNSLVLPVRGTAEQARAAFGPALVEASSAATQPRLAASVTGEILGVLELGAAPAEGRSALRARPGATTTTRSAPARLATAPVPCSAAVTAQGTYSAPEIPYLFNQIADAYDFTRVRAAGGFGTGRTIALMEWEPYLLGDLNAFTSCYGISTNVTNVNIAGGPGTGGGTGIAIKEIQTVVALAPDADVLVYQAGGGSTPTADEWLGVFSVVASNNAADIVSVSWPTCETSANPQFLSIEATLLSQMAAQGQTVMASTGDFGSVYCGSDPVSVDPATQPNILAVGATSMTAVGSPPATRPSETVWNNGSASNGGATGGGVSRLHPMPSWQAGAGVISDRSSGAACFNPGGYCRQVPDVSAFGDWLVGNLYYSTAETGWYVDGGTGVASASWAALTASIQSTSQCAGTRFGLLAPRLYPLGGAGGTAAFNDVTVGDNDMGGTHPTYYAARPGYDMATGLGTPVGGGLLAGLCPAASGGAGGGGGVVREELKPEEPRPERVDAPAPTPPVSPTAQPQAPAPRAELVDGPLIASRDGRFTLGVACPAGGADCRVTVRLRGQGVDLRVRNRRVEAGADRALPLRLPASVRGRKRLTLTATITTTTADGRTSTQTEQVVLRAGRKKG